MPITPPGKDEAERNSGTAQRQRAGGQAAAVAGRADPREDVAVEQGERLR
ncbi:MAG: hypothetical protein ACRDYX_06895 [Egibacteraceae bacterium]